MSKVAGLYFLADTTKFSISVFLKLTKIRFFVIMERTFLKTVEISCFELFLSFGLFLVDVFCISLPLNNYQRINVLNDRHFAVVDDKSKKKLCYGKE